MKQIIVIILTFAICLQTFSRECILLSVKFNREYNTASLSMNKSAKENLYKACCYLKKQVDKSDLEDQNEAEHDNEDGDAIFYELPITLQLLQIRSLPVQISVNERIDSPYLFRYSCGIFRPPDFIG